MADNRDDRPDDRIQPVHFPFLGTLGGLLATSWLLLLLDPAMADFYRIPPGLLQAEWRYAALAVFVALILIDMRRYHRERRQQDADLKALREQVHSLWQDRKQLQLKAHTYSDHADKLKRFISDKLLEYIEYDEKFLHFKSIAAEVRHNGVISFDRVRTALEGALTEAEEAGDEQRAQPLRAAEDAMRYLWDLLDLSTADNLALHIGNRLCECEEHYYQRMLSEDEDSTDELPPPPVYDPGRAAWRALVQVSQKPLEEPAEGTPWALNDGQWYADLQPTGTLLGTENHLVLLLENLLKNAQFHARKRGYSSPFAPVTLQLGEARGNALIRVYNRGPHIREEDRPNLFQLGFSTRRAKEHQGRGLGLYFVNEIVKGYEGQIAVHNIETPATQYAVRVALSDGAVVTELVDVAVESGKPACRSPEGDWQGQLEWTFETPVESVEVTTTDDREQPTQRLADFEAKGKQQRFDPGHPERPRWRLSLTPKRNAHRLSFEPLAIDGVEFEIRLPTAQQRLDNTELGLEDDIDAEVERLDEHFQPPDSSAWR
ncbi:MAG: ATP-binding protein [Pseudomonadota bacterium]